MARAWYKITITEQDYHSTTYTAWVSASSKIQAIAKGAALIGQEKIRRECERTGHAPFIEDLMDPDVKLEPVTLDEFFDRDGTVEVKR